MFSFFSPKPKLLVTTEDKLWIESNLEWMMGQYGTKQFLLPPLTLDYFPFIQQRGRLEQKLRYLMDAVCEQMDVDPKEVDIHTYTAGDNSGFDGPVRVQFENGLTQGEYHHRNNLTGKFDIHLNTIMFEDVEALIGTIAHEVGHIKLLGEFRTTANDEMHEYVTDLTMIYFGFGIIKANTCNTNQTWSDYKGYSDWAIGRSGYLPLEVIVHAVAVQAYLQGEKDPVWANYFEKGVRKMFKQSLLWLHETRDCDARLPQARGGRARDV